LAIHYIGIIIKTIKNPLSKVILFFQLKDEESVGLYMFIDVDDF